MEYKLTPDEQVDQVLASLAIEDMYPDPDVVEKLREVAHGKRSSEELRSEIIKRYSHVK